MNGKVITIGSYRVNHEQVLHYAVGSDLDGKERCWVTFVNGSSLSIQLTKIQKSILDAALDKLEVL